MNETIDTIIAWHKKTFPDATLEGQKAKFEEELNEYNENTTLQELADMYIVACGIARFDSIVAVEYFAIVYKALMDWKTIGSVELVKQIVNKKMEKNRKRVWKKTGPGQYHHEKGIQD